MRNVLAAYCLGGVNDKERQNVRVHLKNGCFQCQSFLHDMQTLTSHLLFSAGDCPPDSRVKKKILLSI